MVYVVFRQILKVICSLVPTTKDNELLHAHCSIRRRAKDSGVDQKQVENQQELEELKQKLSSELEAKKLELFEVVSCYTVSCPVLRSLPSYIYILY